MKIFKPVSEILRSLTTKKVKKMIVYAITSLAVTIIPLWYVYYLLFSPLALTGVDSAVHITISRWMLEEHSILVPFSQFFFLKDANVGYYPALFQGSVGILHVLTGINEVSLLKYSMLLVFLLGAFSIWILSKQLSYGEPIKWMFVYFVLLFNSGLVIKEFRDGIYSEIIAMWFLLPLFIYFFLRRRMAYSVVLLVLILPIHNVSAIMAGALVLSFLIMYILHKEWGNLKFTLKVVVLTLALSVPSLYYYFFLTLRDNVMQNPERSYELLLFSDYPRFLTSFTFYVGIICLVIIAIFNKRYRWLPLWFGMYLTLGYIPYWSSRVMRWMTVPLSLSIGIVVYDVVNIATQGGKIKLPFHKHVKEYNLPNNPKVKMFTLLLLSLIIVYNGIGSLAFESNPTIVDYFTPLKAEAYSWLNARTTSRDCTIVIRQLDSWARVYLNHRVYEVLPPSGQTQLSVPDRVVNNQLTSALMDPYTLDALSTFEKYNISYFILSTTLPQRWYPPETAPFANTLLSINYEIVSSYKLVYQKDINDEMIKIYEIQFPQ
jgi:hypothetical protein